MHSLAPRLVLVFFHNHCTNHEHVCTETCIKYVKKKLEAKQKLRSSTCTKVELALAFKGVPKSTERVCSYGQELSSIRDCMHWQTLYIG
jgi:hypothetical protein